MLKFLRDHANSWIMKILLGILILSFGLFWGVSEFFRGTDKSNIVASIGKLDISKQNLMHSVQEELTKLNRELKGKSITFGQAVQFGLVAQNLNRMVNEIVLDMFMRDVKLAVSDKTIASLIYADPLFQTSQGGFDKAKFLNVLRANGLTEKTFFANRRRALSQMHLLTAISVGNYAPAALSYPIFQALTQKCSFRVATVMPDKVQVGYTEEAVKKFYDNHIDLFKIPEYRDFKLILLEPSKIASRISISEKDVQQAYADQKDSYVTPETRSFSLVVCKDLAEAEKQIRKELKTGDLKDKKRQQDYQGVAEAGLDKPLADVVFKLRPDQVSAPFEWRNQVVLVRLNKIVPSAVTGLSEVRAQITEELKRQKVLDEISRIGEQIEEASNQGLSLVEIGKKLKLSVQEGRIDASGRLIGNESIILTADVVKDVFALSEGAETPLTELPDNTSYLVSVTKITPSRLESFEKVRSKVIKSFVQEKRQAEMQKIADLVKQKLQAGEKVTHPAVVVTETPQVSISEGINKVRLPLPVIQRGFSLAKGQSQVVNHQDQVYVIMPLSIQAVPIEKNIGLYKAYKEDLGKSLTQSLSAGFMESLKKEYKVEIYPATLASLKE